MILHENRLLADHSHEISYLIFFQKLEEKMSQNLLSAAVMKGALRVKMFVCLFGLMLNFPVNSYGHVQMVSSPLIYKT